MAETQSTSDAELPASFTRSPDVRALATDARQEGKLVVWVPRGVRSKEKLFGVLSRALRFPRYFGWNWDALEECLCDLSWLPAETQIVIAHECLPFGDGENRRIYFEILNAVTQNRADGRKVEVVVKG